MAEYGDGKEQAAKQLAAGGGEDFSESNLPPINLSDQAELLSTDGRFIGNLDHGFNEGAIDVGDLSFADYAVKALISEKGYSPEKAREVYIANSPNGAESFNSTDTPYLEIEDEGFYDSDNSSSVSKNDFEPSRNTDPVVRSGLQDLKSNTDTFTSSLGDINPDLAPTDPGTGGLYNTATGSYNDYGNISAEGNRDRAKLSVTYSQDAPNITHIKTGINPFDQTSKPFKETTDIKPDRGDQIDFFTGKPIKGANNILENKAPAGFEGASFNSGSFGDPSSQMDAYNEYAKIESGQANTSGRATKGSIDDTSNDIGIEATFDFIENLMVDIKRKVVENIYPQLVYKTPIDTGTARKGWQVANSESGVVGIPYVVYPEMFGLKPYIKDVPDSIYDHDVVIIGNSVPWIMDLEYGNSRQNSYFIESTVLKVVADLT